MYKGFVKQMIDTVASACILILLLPVFLVLAIIVFVDDPGPVFFAQKRIGKNKKGKISFFKLYKFRSMSVA